MKADENEEKVMTTIDFTLLMHAFAHLISALARIITALRRHRRKKRRWSAQTG